MKSMKKVLASLLALAMVVTAVPVTSASAATTASTNKSSAVVYADSGKTTTVKVTTPSTWKNVKLTATPKRSTVVTTKVNSSKQIVRFYAQTSEVANTKVVISVSYKENGVKQSKKLAVQAYVRDVKVKIATDETGETEETSGTVAVGETVSLNYFTAPASAKSSVTFVSSDPTVATVTDNGAITGVAEGTATVTATVTYGEKTATTSYEVTVGPAELQSVSQATLTTINAVFSGDASSYTESDITVTNNYTSANFSVKSVSGSGSDITIETYADMNDGQEYSVTCNGVTQTFTATDGTIAEVTINTTDITEATETGIYAILSDANGVTIGTYDYKENNSIAVGSNTLDFTIDVTSGYVSGANLYLNEAGDTATANLTYHTWTYDDDGNETGYIESGDIIITAVSASEITTSGWDVKYLADADDDIDAGDYSYSSVTTTKIATSDSCAYAYVQITLSDGSTETDVSDYSFSSSDDDIMTVDDTNSADGYLTITPYKTGSAYIIVKDSNGSTETTLALTVVSARVATTLKLSSTSVTLSTSVTVGETETITATVTDQYGEAFTLANELDIENVTDGDEDSLAEASGNEITVDATKLKTAPDTGKSATYTIKVTAEGSLSKTFKVIAKTPEEEVDHYALELKYTTVDAVITSDLEEDTVNEVAVYGYDSNNVKNAVVDSVTYTLIKGSETLGSSEENSDYFDDDGNIQINDIDVGTQIATGTYKVKAEFEVDENTVSQTKSFVVTNSQPKATATVEVKTLGTGEDLNSIILVKYDGTDYSYTSGNDNVITSYTKSDGTESDNAEVNESGSLHITSIKVTIPIGSNCVQQTITIGKTIKITE